MIIFKTTNLINGMFYVGQHDGSKAHYLGSGTAVRKAIKEYGRENFTREILEVCTPENVNAREQYWIRELQAVELGYNKPILLTVGIKTAQCHQKPRKR